MQNEVSTQVNDQSVIIFHDGGEKWITKGQMEFIMQQSVQPNKKSVLIDGSMFTFSSMAKILSAQEYYSQYPEKIPEARSTWEYQEVKPMTEEGLKKMRTGVLAGLKQFIDEAKARGENPVNAQAVYDKHLEKITHSNQICQTLTT